MVFPVDPVDELMKFLRHSGEDLVILDSEGVTREVHSSTGSIPLSHSASHREVVPGGAGAPRPYPGVDTSGYLFLYEAQENLIKTYANGDGVIKPIAGNTSLHDEIHPQEVPGVARVMFESYGHVAPAFELEQAVEVSGFRFNKSSARDYTFGIVLALHRTHTLSEDWVQIVRFKNSSNNNNEFTLEARKHPDNVGYRVVFRDSPSTSEYLLPPDYSIAITVSWNYWAHIIRNIQVGIYTSTPMETSFGFTYSDNYPLAPASAETARVTSGGKVDIIPPSGSRIYLSRVYCKTGGRIPCSR